MSLVLNLVLYIFTQMARSPAFNLGGTYPPNRQQQQQNASVNNGGAFAPGNNQDLLHMHGSDLYPSSHGTYHSHVRYPI